jgi:hypothetical protein
MDVCISRKKEVDWKKIVAGNKLGIMTGDEKRENLILTDIVMIRLPQGLATSCPRAFRPGTHPTENPPKALPVTATLGGLFMKRRTEEANIERLIARPQAPSS